MHTEHTVGLLDVLEIELAPICRRHGIRRLSLFGSRLTGTARPDNDVDLQVEFEARLSLFSPEPKKGALR